MDQVVIHYDFGTTGWTSSTGISLEQSLSQMGVNGRRIFQTVWWTSCTVGFIYLAHKQFVEHFPGCNLIYTGCCLSGSKAASAAVLGDEAFSLRLPDTSSIFTAEMYALLIAFQQTEKVPRSIFFSDSKSALQAFSRKIGQIHWFYNCLNNSISCLQFWLKPSIFVGFLAILV